MLRLAASTLAPLVTLTLLTACHGTEPSPAFPGSFHAAATPACAPTDAAAVTIFFTQVALATPDPTAPYAQVAIYRPLESIVGNSWTVGTDGAAFYQPAHGAAAQASRGSLTITTMDPDSTLHGSVSITFDGNVRLDGTFAATWLPRRFLCG
jgi:hypothetical protein